MCNGVGHLAALSTGLASFYLDSDELSSTLSITHDGLRQLACHLQHSLQQGLALRTLQTGYGRVLRFVGGDDHKRIVGRSIAIHRDAVERAFGQCQRQLLHQGRCNACVGGYITQHGGHIGADHACAFADARHAHRDAANLHLCASCFWHSVCGHDAFSSIRPLLGTARVACCGDGCGHARDDAVVWQLLHDDAGGKRQHLIGRNVQDLSQSLAGFMRALQAFLASPRIGVASVDHHRANALTSIQMVSANLHRGCTKPVLCENAANGCTLVNQDNGQIFAA